MRVEIELIDRIYNNICDFCEANGVDAYEYMSDAITEKYNLDKYGDLNEKLVGKSVKSQKNSLKKVKNENDIREDTKTQIVEDRPTEEKKEEAKQVNTLAAPVAEADDKVKPTKIKRTLKTK